ncbi:MAG: DUF2569 domain-containing protein [Thermoanaerobaculia bacterium]
MNPDWPGSSNLSPLELLSAEKGPVGIGGWLLLVLFGLAMFIVRSGWSIATELLPLFTPEQWRSMNSPENPLSTSSWSKYLLLSTASSIALVVFAILVVVLFLRRSRRLPLFITLFYVFAAVQAGYDALSLRQLAVELPDTFEPSALRSADLTALRAVLVTVVWGGYFRVSARVRNTFVR